MLLLRIGRWFAAVVLVGLALSAARVDAQDATGPQPDSVYANYLASDGWVLAERRDADLNRDGQQETVVLAIEQDCVSCHAQRLMVFSGTDPLLDLNLDDPQITLLPGEGLDIWQPQRQESEPLCCPSVWWMQQVRWNTDTDTFDVWLPQ